MTLRVVHFYICVKFLPRHVSTTYHLQQICRQVASRQRRRVLGKSSGVGEVGSIQWELLLCLLLTWVVLYFCVWRGIGWTSKVVYFTATFPLVVLLVLLVRGLTLDGAMDGLVFYLRPDTERLKDVQVWLDAATQVFFSYALCKGMLITMGSYNNYKYNSYRDCIMLSVLNSAVSFVSGLAIFSVLGFMAKEQFVGLESMMSAFIDLRPDWFKKPWRREIVLAGLCVIQFLVGISMITNGGVYVLNIFDNYAAAGWSLLFISFFECIAIGWLFGINKYWSIVVDMISFQPRINWFKWCWFIITPIATVVSSVVLHVVNLVVVDFQSLRSQPPTMNYALCRTAAVAMSPDKTLLIVSLVHYKPLTYNKTYVYPPWAVGIAWMLAMSSMIWIPAYAIYRLVSISKGTFTQRWKLAITSELDSKSEGSDDKQAINAVSDFVLDDAQFEMAPLYQDVFPNNA